MIINIDFIKKTLFKHISTYQVKIQKKNYKFGKNLFIIEFSSALEEAGAS